MQTMITTECPEFKSWLAKVAELDRKYITENFKNLQPNVYTAEDGQKFIRVVQASQSATGRSVHCFIAKVDSETKALGKVRAGGILKPASWKAPAKHARGNILDEHGGMSQMGPYGPASRR